MKPQITIEQLRRAVNNAVIETIKNIPSFPISPKDVVEISGKLDSFNYITSIIDNPEKYKHLWEDGK